MTTTDQPDAAVRSQVDTGVSSGGARLAGIAGIVGAVLFVGSAIPIFDSPSLGDPAGDIRTWFADNEGYVSFFTWLMPLSVLLLVVFGAGLKGRLDRVDRTGVLARVSFAGIVAQAAAGLVSLGYWGVLAQDSVRDDASDSVLTALNALDTVTFFVTVPWAIALFVGAASVVILMTRAMPVWLGWLGVVVAVASALSGLWILSGDVDSPLAGLGFIGFLGSNVWVVALGVVMLRSADR
jgi:hypothetical protein